MAGTVTAVNTGGGLQYPSIAVNGVQIEVAPAWYLLEKGFELQAGSSVSVTAAPSGVALWTSRGGSAGSGAGPMAEGGCMDASTTATATGTVEAIGMGVGMQMPTLTLKAAAGTLLAIERGPERILLEAGIELKTGDTLTVKYAGETCTGELVALALTAAAGSTIVLRDGDGTPAWH